MSVCVCPEVGFDGMFDSKHKHHVQRFFERLEPEGRYGEAGWSLLSVVDYYKQFGEYDSIPFRGGACSRTRKCCGECTRICNTRCVQDCLHRLYMWHQMVEYTPVEERDKLPLAIRLIVKQRFASHEQLSRCVSEIISAHTNPELAKYIEEADLGWQEHPQHLNYGPAVVMDPATGKRRVNPNTGEISYRNWPESGLCPHCLPSIAIDSRFIKRGKV